jgi:kynurenine formamidase
MRVIDLTMRITPSMKVFPGSPRPAFIPWSKFDSHGYDSEAMFMSTHTGTHVDAPSHFAPGLESIDMIPASRLVASAVLVKAKKGANGLVEPGDFAGVEIRKGDAVVMAENPGLSARAAKYLAAKKINIVAIDGPSIDAGFDDRFSAHNILLPRSILIAENLCNVGKISAERFTLVISPLKLGGATGSPARVFALV